MTENVADDPAVTVRLAGCEVMEGAITSGVEGVDGGLFLLSFPQPKSTTQNIPNVRAKAMRCRRISYLMFMAGLSVDLLEVCTVVAAQVPVNE